MRKAILLLIVLSLFPLVSAEFGYNKIDSGSSVTITTINTNYTNFTQLLDVPHNYTGFTLQSVRVNVGETGLEFFTPSTGGNASWNQSYANTLYADIKWGYNQTLAAIANINSRFYNITQIDAFNASWTSTFNSTYAANTGNATFNQSLTDTLYASILWNYNQSLYVVNTYGQFWYNYTVIGNAYTDTRVNGVNTTLNIGALNFYNNSQVDNKFLNLSGTNANTNLNIGNNNVTLSYVKFNATGTLDISSNSTCTIIRGPTSVLCLQ